MEARRSSRIFKIVAYNIYIPRSASQVFALACIKLSLYISPGISGKWSWGISCDWIFFRTFFFNDWFDCQQDVLCGNNAVGRKREITSSNTISTLLRRINNEKFSVLLLFVYTCFVYSDIYFIDYNITEHFALYTVTERLSYKLINDAVGYFKNSSM